MAKKPNAKPTVTPITADDPEAKSADVVAANLEKLKALFPEAVSEDGVNVDVLNQLIGRIVTDAEEKYGLNWHGKRKARQLALAPSAGTLRPCPEESVDWDTTQNLFIEGDNLEVLKLLQKPYASTVKMIYIDPPYNTGGDFVYPDDFQDNIKNYLELTGQVTSDGATLSSNSESSGRFHTQWLNMMYPRMRVARHLLCSDGVLFVSVDDTEVNNLRLMLDETFGVECFVAAIAWKKRSSPDARDTIGSIHDWLLCYVRNKDLVKTAIGKMELSEERRAAYTNPDDDERGPWASVDMTGMMGRATAEQYYDVELPSGRVIGPPEGRSWGIAKATFERLRSDNRIWFGTSGDNVPRIKNFLSESEGQVVPSFWDMQEVGSNEEAKKEVNELMEQSGVFDTPKPVRLISRMLDIGTPTTGPSIVVDFFAGSGTTGHAVMKANAVGEGDRRFVLVQLPEPLNESVKSQRIPAEYCSQMGKPMNIAELTKERLRRSGKAVKAATPLFDGDVGFRVFKLDTSNIRAWNPDPDDLEGTLQEHTEHLAAGRGETDVLYELLLKLGLDLAVPIETRQVEGKDVHAVGAGTLFACLAESISRDDVEALAQAIIDWHKELAPEGETTIVFRDSSFADDVAKSNLAAILVQAGFDDTRIRSL
jgi:adenine-specific DNA-methyltransferase